MKQLTFISMAGVLDGFEECRAQEADFDEVVEVPGLKARVLSIVGKAQQLARPVGRRALPTQLVNGRQRQDRRCGASPF